MDTPRIPIPRDQVAAFCEKWRVTELALFGSVLSDEFRPDSDVDVLVTFEPDAPWTLTHLVRMRDELESLLGRHVDLVEKGALHNPYIRKHVLDSCQVVYAA
jgi:hypothetical protein